MATLVIDPLAPRLRIAAFEEGRRRYDQDMAYQREQDAYKRQMDEERLNYDRMNNDRQYRFNRDKFNWQKQNADFLNRRLEEDDNRAAAKRWADGLNRGEYQRALAVTDGTAQPYYPENAINPYQREAVRLRRAADERAALNYERQQQAAQQKHDWAMEAATGTALRQAQSAEAKAQEQSRYNHGMLAIQSELGKYTLSEGVKPEAAARVIYDIARQRNISPAEAVREVARIYGWPGGDEAETAAAQENQGGGQPVGPGIPLNSKAGTADGGAGAREYKRAEEAVADNIRLIEGYQAQLKQMKERGEDSYDRPGAFHRNHTVKVKSRKYEQIENALREIEKRNAQLLEQYPEIRNSIAGDTVWVSPETAGGLK